MSENRKNNRETVGGDVSGEKDMKGVSQLLDKAGKVLKDIEKQMSEGAGFNVFSLCGVDHYETMHSKILAEFLNPQGRHGQRTLFLKCFQQMLKDHFKFEGEFSDSTSVTTEIAFGGDRLDILIEDESRKSICVIENKIFAGEQPEQLERYSKWLDGERKRLNTEHEKCILLFLTLNGREACSIKAPEKYCRMAYVRNDDNKNLPFLGNWIDSCCKKMNSENAVRNTLEQYKNHINNLAKGERAMEERLLEVITRGRFMEAAEKVTANYSAIKWRIIGGVIDDVRARIVQKLRIGSTLEKYVKSNQSTEPSYRLDIAKLKTPIWITWQRIDDMRMWVGVHATDFSKEKLKRFRQWLKIPNGWETDNATWPLYKWLDGDGARTPTWDGKFLDGLLKDTQCRTEVIDKIANDIVDLYQMIYKFQNFIKKSKR